MDDLCLALDLGGTKLLIGVVTPGGEILASRRYPSPLTETSTQQEVVAGVLQSLRDFMQEEPLAGKASCVGMGLIGRVDCRQGLWLEIDPGRMETVPLASRLTGATGLPAYIDNDVRCATRAELNLGAGRGRQHFLYVNIGTGIAAGQVVEGRIIHGGHYNGGEVGHVAVDIYGGVRCPCGRTGCVEAIAAGSGLSRRAGELRSRYPRTALKMSENGRVRADELFRLAREGDALCIRLAHEAAEAIAALLCNLTYAIDPELIVLGGGIVSDPWMFDQIVQRMPTEVTRFLSGIERTGLDPALVGLIGASQRGFAGEEGNAHE